MPERPPEEPHAPLVPVVDEVSGRVVAHYDPDTGCLRVKVWRSRRAWIDVRGLLDKEETK